MAGLKTMKLYKDDSFIIVNIADVAKYKKLGFSRKLQEMKPPDNPPLPVITEDISPVIPVITLEKPKPTKAGKADIASSDTK